MNQSGHCKVWCNILKSQNVYRFILRSKFIDQGKGREREKNSQASERESERNGFAVISNIRGGGGGRDSFVQ